MRCFALVRVQRVVKHQGGWGYAFVRNWEVADGLCRSSAVMIVRLAEEIVCKCGAGAGDEFGSAAG
jgi:hypothetical protein